MRLLLAALALAGALSAAFAHDQWGNPNWIANGQFTSPIDGSHCCGTSDCAVIEKEDVHVVTGGLHVRGVVTYGSGAGAISSAIDETVPRSERSRRAATAATGAARNPMARADASSGRQSRCDQGTKPMKYLLMVALVASGDGNGSGHVPVRYFDEPAPCVQAAHQVAALVQESAVSAICLDLKNKTIVADVSK